MKDTKGDTLRLRSVLKSSERALDLERDEAAKCIRIYAVKIDNAVQPINDEGRGFV